MWEREHTPLVLEVWEPRRSVWGSKRRHQCTGMNLDNVDTTIVSPKSINSIPEDYVTVLCRKLSALEASVLHWIVLAGPFISPIWGGFLIHNSGIKTHQTHQSASEAAGTSDDVWASPWNSPITGKTGSIGGLLSAVGPVKCIWSQTPKTSRWTRPHRYRQRELRPSAVTSAAVQLQITAWKFRNSGEHKL